MATDIVELVLDSEFANGKWSGHRFLEFRPLTLPRNPSRSYWMDTNTTNTFRNMKAAPPSFQEGLDINPKGEVFSPIMI